MAEGRIDIRLDTPEGCRAELQTCSKAIAEMAHEWSTAAGKLVVYQKAYDRMYKAALRETSGNNADERTSIAHVAAEEAWRKVNQIGDDDPGLSERIENEIGTVERCRRLFDTLERRSSNAQSILSYERETGKMGSMYQPNPEQVGRG